MKINLKKVWGKFCKGASKHWQLWVTILAIMFVCSTNVAFANDGTQLLDNLFKFIATWIARIGGLVAFLGAIQFAFGWVNHNPDARLQGLTMILAGFMTVGITRVPHLFGM